MAIVEAGYFEEAVRRLQSTGTLRGGVETLRRSQVYVEQQGLASLLSYYGKITLWRVRLWDFIARVASIK